MVLSVPGSQDVDMFTLRTGSLSLLGSPGRTGSTEEASHPREDIRPSREEVRRQDVSHQREETRPSREEAKRQEASHTREETRPSMEEARGLEANAQVFVEVGYSQPPPGYTMINFPGLEQPGIQKISPG